MDFWLVNPFDPLPSDRGVRRMRYQMLVTELLRRGHSVTWVSSDFWHWRKAYRQPDSLNDLPAGLQIVLLPTRRYQGNISINRLINHAQYCVRLRQWMERSAPPDGIIVSYPLPEAALDCLHYGRKHGVPVLVDVQDTWPDIFLEILPPGLRWVGRGLLGKMFQQSRQVFQLAEHCVAVSQNYLRFALARRKGRPFAFSQVYPLGFDPADIDGDDSRTLADLTTRGFTPETINFSFVGTLGVTYDIACLIKAAQIIAQHEPRVRFFIAGEGPRKAEWQALAASLGLQNLIFLGFLNAAQMRTLLSHSFAGLITTRNNLHSIPNKPLEYMAFGLPLINSLKGEFGQLVDGEPLGVSYEAENVASLVQAIRRLLDDPGFANTCRQHVREVFAQRFSAKAIYPAYVDDLEQICAPEARLLGLGR